MQLLLDQLAWGNPAQEDVRNMETPTFLDDLLPRLKQQDCFANSSDATREELKQLVGYSEYQDHSIRRRIFDQELVPAINALFVKNGCDGERLGKVTHSVVIDVLPLITKLKYHFQRPRPFQLAYYLGVRLYPNFSHFVSSPSYPSGHCVMGAVLTEVLATQYSSVFPDLPEVMRKFCAEVMESRLYMGVHYPSDNRFALQVSQAIVDHKHFRRKYDF